MSVIELSHVWKKFKKGEKFNSLRDAIPNLFRRVTTPEQGLQEKESPRELNYWRTHPFIPQRISAVNQEITGQLEFRDYLNLTGEK